MAGEKLESAGGPKVHIGVSLVVGRPIGICSATPPDAHHEVPAVLHCAGGGPVRWFHGCRPTNRSQRQTCSEQRGEGTLPTARSTLFPWKHRENHCEEVGVLNRYTFIAVQHLRKWWP